MAIYILCAAAFDRLEQLLDSYRWAAEQLQNTAMCLKGLHSFSAARCNLTLAAKRLQRSCKLAANPKLRNYYYIAALKQGFDLMVRS